MALSLRNALYASLASSALTLGTPAFGDQDNTPFSDDNAPALSLVESQSSTTELGALAADIFQTQKNQSTDIRNIRGHDAIGDYSPHIFAFWMAALKSADEGITDPAEIAELAIELINAQDVPRLQNGAPVEEFRPYYIQDIYNEAVIIDAAIYFAISNHPDVHSQEELALIVIEDIIDNVINGEKDREALLSRALNKALHSIDPHSRFIPETAVQDMLNNTRGSFSGIGANVSTDHSQEFLQARQDEIDAFYAPYIDEEGYFKEDISEEQRLAIRAEYAERFPPLTIIEGLLIERLIQDDAPAALAGIKPGDIVTHVNDQPLSGLTTEEAVELVKGPTGTDVDLTIRREGEANALTITVTRGNVAISPVSSRLIDGNVGVIYASQFNDQTDRFVDEAIRDLTSQGAEYFILDLRDNPGGIMGQADAMVNNFIDGEGVSRLSPAEVIERNTIISQRTARGKQPTNFARPGTETDAPVVVLINERSASASEIVAGVLQNYDRATIVGTQSFGKGNGQSVIPLDIDRDGNPDAIVNITSFFYYVGRGDGHNIQGVGITPDIRLSEEFSAVSKPRNSESGLNATLVRPEDGNYNRQSEAECRPSSSDATSIELPEDLRLRNNRLDPWIACALSHLKGPNEFVQIAPIEQATDNLPGLDTQ